MGSEALRTGGFSEGERRTTLKVVEGGEHVDDNYTEWVERFGEEVANLLQRDANGERLETLECKMLNKATAGTEFRPVPFSRNFILVGNEVLDGEGQMLGFID